MPATLDFLDPDTGKVTRDISVKEWCQLTNGGTTAVYDLMNRGELAFYMLGRVRRIPCGEVNRIRGILSNDNQAA